MKEHRHSQAARDMLRGLDLTGEAEAHRHPWASSKVGEQTGVVLGHSHEVTIGLITGLMETA